jgi:hypothetical protein
MFSNDLLLVYGKETSILSQIRNVDENAVFLSMPHDYAVNSKGETQGAMKTKGYKMLCVTVLLCITANGNKLPSQAQYQTESQQTYFCYEFSTCQYQDKRYHTTDLSHKLINILSSHCKHFLLESCWLWGGHWYSLNAQVFFFLVSSRVWKF